MSATDDVARMLTLVPWLLERPGASFTEIATTFGVDEATVRRDLGALDFCGLPGLGGGDLFEVSTVGDRVVVRMADELKRPLRPTPREALRLVLTVDAVADVVGDEVPALRSALDKIRAAFGIPPSTADVVDADDPRVLSGLRAAVRAGRQVTLSYQGRAAEQARRRVVDPWALHVLDGTWYLQAHDHASGQRRVFRLDRIVAVEPGQRAIEVPRPEELPPPRYVPGPDDLTVTLDLRPEGRWIVDAVVADEVEEAAGGHATVRLRTDAPGWVARLVLMAAGAAQVVEPLEVAEEVTRLARRARARYDERAER